MHIDINSYPQQLADKTTALEKKFSQLAAEKQIGRLADLEIFESPVKHFRMRAEFRIWHEQNNCFPVMFEQSTKQRKKITQFPIACQSIDQLIQSFEQWIGVAEILQKRLFQIELLSAQSGETALTLIYHKKLDAHWEHAAQQLQEYFKTNYDFDIHIIGRSRKQKIILNQDFISESFMVKEQTLRYKQLEGSFTQPNAHINQRMLNWVSLHSQNLDGDALELYCGNGNFTVVLAQNFSKVFATELVKTAVKCAQFNLSANNINNTNIARMSSEEFTQAMNGTWQFRRLKDIDLNCYQFSTLLVDPPRSGLDEETCRLAQTFDNIIYISCNPDTLIDNLMMLCDTHSIKQRACFDQFPYTHHLESAVILKRK